MTSSPTTTIGVLAPDIVTLIPYSAARRLRAIAVAATPKEVTVLLPPAEEDAAVSELRALTGLRVASIETPAERIDTLLDRLAGSLESNDLWLQRRHIQALSRLVDHSVNVGQVEQVRSLVDRALEFAPYSAELWLMKARVSSQRTEVVRALTIASDIAPNDRRVLRWTQSLQDPEPDEPAEGSPERQAGPDKGSPAWELDASAEVGPPADQAADPGTGLMSAPPGVAEEVPAQPSAVTVEPEPGDTGALPPVDAVTIDTDVAASGFAGPEPYRDESADARPALGTTEPAPSDVSHEATGAHEADSERRVAASEAEKPAGTEVSGPVSMEYPAETAASPDNPEVVDRAEAAGRRVVDRGLPVDAAGQGEAGQERQPDQAAVADELPLEEKGAGVPAMEDGATVAAAPDVAVGGETGAGRAASTQRAHVVDDELLQSGLELTKIRDLGDLMERTGELVARLAAADSATVFFKGEKSWVGWTSDEHLAAHLTRAVPKHDRLAAQVIKQGLPLAIPDTASRMEDVGRLVCDAGVRSFALLPIRTDAEVGGLIYLNYRTPNRADMIFAPDLGRRVELVLTCAGVAAAAIRQKDAVTLQPATFDELTAAYSLDQFERLLGIEIDRARRYRYSVALLSFDLDDFAQVNAVYGRDAGDQVLREVCSRVLGLGRTSDVLARRGEDEFLFMLPQTTGKGAEILSRRIHGALEDPVMVATERVSVSLSIGLASYPERADDAQGLIQAAEIALYGAKAQGKHRTHVADTLSLSN
jgi:diguanylate cyclase (GGDEF)-like protein